jgi:hypothetical protein
MSSEQVECANPDCDETFTKQVHNQKYHSVECKRTVERRLRKRELMEDLNDLVKKAYLDDVDDDDKIDFLRKENMRLAKLVEKHKNIRDEVKVQFEVAIKEIVEKNKPPVIDYKYKPDQRATSELVAVAILADWQLGKKEDDYDSKTCHERLVRYAHEVVAMTKVFRNIAPIKHLRVWVLGDIVEGEDIFPGQNWEIDSSLYSQVAVNGPAIFRDVLNIWLEEFEDIEVAAVMGNHGRIGRPGHFNPETNMDRILYKILDLMYLENDRIKFTIPDGYGKKSWYYVDSIGNYSTMLLHGDQFSAPSGSQYSYYKKVMGWKDCGIPEKFQDVYMGHYHQSVKMTLGSTILRISPSPESSNGFAQETLGVMGRPAQDLMFVDPVKGSVLSEHTIYLD